MSQDYFDGLAEGYRQAMDKMKLELDEEKAKHAITASQRKTILDLLEAAVRVVKAYGEDEGYTPRHVAEDVELLERARLL
jgi:TRAP-type C4-dicarboxylate transport system substrate-binding protein